MNTEAIIDLLRTQADTCRGMRDVLEDGQALKELGIIDADQEQVEEAHYILSSRSEIVECIENCENKLAELKEELEKC